MAYDKSYIRFEALIRGINLFENVLIRMDTKEIGLETVSANWIREEFPTINDQIKMIISTSADDVASKYLAKRLNKLNAHLSLKNSHNDYARRLTRLALDALVRALRAHCHIWEGVKISALNTAFSFGTVVPAKRLPYYAEIDEKEEKKKKKRLPLSVDSI